MMPKIARYIIVGALQGSALAYVICTMQAEKLTKQSGVLFLLDNPASSHTAFKEETQLLWVLVSVLVPVGALLGAVFWSFYRKATSRMPVDLQAVFYPVFVVICIVSISSFIPSTETAFVSSLWKQGQRLGMVKDFLAHHPLMARSRSDVEDWLGTPENSTLVTAEDGTMSGTVIYEDGYNGNLFIRYEKSRVVEYYAIPNVK